MFARIEGGWTLTVVITAAVVAGACTSNPAPDGWLPDAKNVPANPFGAWIELDIGDSEQERQVSGEFLAVQSDSLFVLNADRYHAYSISEISHARVAWYDSGYSTLALWTGGGSLLSLSHGAFGVISLPLWILVGSLATATQSNSPFAEYVPGESGPESLRMYARFPHGIPPDVDRTLLRGRRPSP